MDDIENYKGDSYGKKAVVGAALMVATRFSVRLLGLVSVTILARLLTPEDFGVFGTAALVLAFFILIKDVGFGPAVIKTQNLSKADIDTLWTMRFLLAVFTAVVLYILAEPIAVFLKEPRAIAVLQVMALIPVLDSFYSPASALLIKEFKFARDFILKSVDKLIRVAAVIILALTLQSYWALVYGALLASFFGVIVSQIAKPYWPRLTLESRDKFLSFAFWSYCRGVARYIATSADEFVVRASENSAFFGIYHVSRDLTRILIAEIISPVGEALLPALVKFSGDVDRFAKAVTDIVGVYFIAAVAISLGIIATSEEIILLLLGPQWQQAATFLALVAIGGACNALGDINQSIFIAQNVPKYGAIFWSVRAASYSVFCLTAGLLWGATGVAIAFSATSAVILIIEITCLFSVSGASLSWGRLMLRPLFAGAMMMGALGFIPEQLDVALWLYALLKVSLGASVYVGTLFGLWFMIGKPQGPEYSVIERLPNRIRTRII